MFATRENYLYGCTLLNLHGLYYSTYGSHWEWAPPCYHFRMPYWEHMDVFLKYFERLSYLLSQGHLVADVAVVYPVAPYEAEMNGDKSKETAFALAQRLMRAGINFEFIDNDSLARAVVEDGRLVVKAAGASYQALILPNMDAVRWPTIEKAAAFAEAGGKVYAVGSLPSASDRAGRDDPELEAMNEQAFKPECRFAEPDAAVEAIRNAFVQDVSGIGRPVRALHRKVGPRDVYFVMDASAGHGRRVPRQRSSRTVGCVDRREPAVARRRGDRHRHPGRTAARSVRSPGRRVHARPPTRQSAGADEGSSARRRCQRVDRGVRADHGQHATAISDCRSQPTTS